MKDNKLKIFLVCVYLALSVSLGISLHKLSQAWLVIDKQERQLKELYGQVNEITLQYVEIVKRINTHGDLKQNDKISNRMQF